MSAINSAKLSQMMRDLARMPSRVSTKIANDLSKEIQRNFDRGVDPFGRRWRKLAQSTIEGGRHPPPLTDTGRGRRSVKVQAMSGAGIRMTVGVLYMIYHQFGGPSHLRGPGGSYRLRKRNKHFGRDADRSGGRENPPRRSFMPQGNERPPRWMAIINKCLEEAALKVLKRG